MHIFIILISISLILQIIAISTQYWSKSEFFTQLVGNDYLTTKTNAGLWKVCSNIKETDSPYTEINKCFDTNIKTELKASFTAVKVFAILGTSLLLLILGIVLFYEPLVKYKNILLKILLLSFLSNLIVISIWLLKIQKNMGDNQKTGNSMIIYIIGAVLSLSAIILKQRKLIK